MKKSTFLIVGKHAVLEALKNPNRKIERVFLTEDAQKKLNRENQNLNLFKKINVFYKSRKELDNLCGRDETAHQGLVAEVEQLEEVTLKEFVLEIPKNDGAMKLRDPNEIYLDIYKAAKEKARQAKLAAVKAYLEAKKIKQTYLIDELDTSDDDSEFDDEVFSEK